MPGLVRRDRQRKRDLLRIQVGRSEGLRAAGRDRSRLGLGALRLGVGMGTCGKCESALTPTWIARPSGWRSRLDLPVSALPPLLARVEVGS